LNVNLATGTPARHRRNGSGPIWGYVGALGTGLVAAALAFGATCVVAAKTSHALTVGIGYNPIEVALIAGLVASSCLVLVGTTGSTRTFTGFFLFTGGVALFGGIMVIQFTHLQVPVIQPSAGWLQVVALVMIGLGTDAAELT
jgi:hypothetical protein